MLDQRRPAGARGLLVGVGRDQDLAGQRDPEVRERLDREHHRRDPALHVAGASPEEEAVADLGHERIAGPFLSRLRRDDVDVAVEHERAAASAAREPCDQLRPAGEVEPRRDQRPALHRVRIRLPDIDRGSGGLESRPEIFLERRLLPRRIADLARGRVEPDQRAGEADEIVASGRDRVAYVSLGVGQRHSPVLTGVTVHTR